MRFGWQRNKLCQTLATETIRAGRINRFCSLRFADNRKNIKHRPSSTWNTLGFVSHIRFYFEGKKTTNRKRRYLFQGWLDGGEERRGEHELERRGGGGGGLNRGRVVSWGKSGICVRKTSRRSPDTLDSVNPDCNLPSAPQPWGLTRGFTLPWCALWSCWTQVGHGEPWCLVCAWAASAVGGFQSHNQI